MLCDDCALSEQGARLLNPLQLAYVGDSVWDLLVRQQLIRQRISVRHLHRSAVTQVNAAAQAQALQRILPLLSPEEETVMLCGRNAHAHHAAPRHQQLADYKAATALEALIGYLYLSGQDSRLRQLFQAAAADGAAPQNEQ